MFCCIHDPGMALFLAETRPEDGSNPGPLEWTAFAATVLLAAVALSVPA
jgi:hypothetical protein